MSKDVTCSVCAVALPAAQRLAGPIAIAVVSGIAGGAATKSFWGGLATAVVSGLVSHAIVAAAEPVCGRCRAGAETA